MTINGRSNNEILVSWGIWHCLPIQIHGDIFSELMSTLLRKVLLG